MNTSDDKVIVGNQVCYIARVMRFGTRGFGFAKNGNERAYFHMDKGLVIKAQGESVVFSKDKVFLEPKLGEKIVVMVNEGENGFYCVKWGCYSDYEGAVNSIKMKKEGGKCPPKVELHWIRRLVCQTVGCHAVKA